MNYFFARLAIFAFRVLGYVVLVPSALLFVWCLILVVPPVLQNGLNADTVANGRGGIEMRQRLAEGRLPDAVGSLNMDTSEVSTGLVAGAAALSALVTAVLLLAACDVFAAILDSARNSRRLLEHFQAKS